jgi:hypothetical protein
MGKAKFGFLLGGAYALGVAILLVIALSLPCGTLPRVRLTLAHIPLAAHHALQLAKVAVHAGQLGVKHLPAALDRQGGTLRRHSGSYCVRQALGGSDSSIIALPVGALTPLGPALVRIVLSEDEE